MTDTSNKTAPRWEPKEVKIKHGAFWYYSREKYVVPATGQEEDRLIQRFANQNDKVTLVLASDYNRGVEFGAFYTDDEVATYEARISGSVGVLDGEDIENGPANVPDLDDEGLADWLTATGQFDGHKKPNADEVVAAAGGDRELASRLLTAEERASGGDPRKGVKDGLSKVIEAEQA